MINTAQRTQDALCAVSHKGGKGMNPWEEIRLSDYEEHMKLDSVHQLQALNEMMKKQLSAYPVETAAIFGIAGGNGLEHIDRSKYRKVYGIDINEMYLAAVTERYAWLGDVLECRRTDIISESDKLPQAELIIADLLIEYVGYEAFQKSVLKTGAKYVSCIIQINTDEKAWVSDSPYIHAFDGLDAVHHQMGENELTAAMAEIDFRQIKTDEYPLPNGKKLVMLDYIIRAPLKNPF